MLNICGIYVLIFCFCRYGVTLEEERTAQQKKLAKNNDGTVYFSFCPNSVWDNLTVKISYVCFCCFCRNGAGI